MGEWLEVLLLSAWAGEAEGPAVCTELPQMCTLIMANQSTQVRGAAEMESAEKADKCSSRALG